MLPVNDPLEAVTHGDPYPYYARLVAEQPLYYDATLGMWVATGSAEAAGVLTSELCRVRPVAEPVPAALATSPAGVVFRNLVRMNDGERHAAMKRAVSIALAAVDLDEAAASADRWSGPLIAEPAAQGNRTQALDGMAALSVYVVGGLLGIPDDRLPQLASWVRDFARCIAPGSNPVELERGGVAAERLSDLLRSLAAVSAEATDVGLLVSLMKEMRRDEPDGLALIVANAIGFLFQTFDATAGLIGNTLRALIDQPELHAELSGKPKLLGQALQEVLRYDAPVQNTRRFGAEDGVVAGRELCAGDVVLVVLAAANRDPALNPEPDRFDIHRTDRQSLAFSSGPHCCPGTALATTVAAAAVGRLLADGVDLAALVDGSAYRPSANARIPL